MIIKRQKKFSNRAARAAMNRLKLKQYKQVINDANIPSMFLTPKDVKKTGRSLIKMNKGMPGDVNTSINLKDFLYKDRYYPSERQLKYVMRDNRKGDFTFADPRGKIRDELTGKSGLVGKIWDVAR